MVVMQRTKTELHLRLEWGSDGIVGGEFGWGGNDGKGGKVGEGKWWNRIKKILKLRAAVAFHGRIGKKAWSARLTCAMVNWDMCAS